MISKLPNNIYLAYFLAFFHNLLFWMGIWLLFYLNITDYAGVGLVESTWLLLHVFGEVPTGALADLLGKKKSLIMAFLFGGLGNILMGMSGTLVILIISVLIQSVGGIMLSGTFEALIYDSLKMNALEGEYSKILANIQSISLGATAVASIVGGYLYQLNHSLPFYLAGFGFLLAMTLSFWLKEPKVDTEVFNFQNYIVQAKQGFRQLFQRKYLVLIIIMVIMSFFFQLMNEMVDDSLALSFGINTSIVLGYFYAGLSLFSAITVQFSTLILQKLGINKTMFIVGLIYALILIISPILGIVLGGITIYLRATLDQILKNSISTVVNNISESKYRATTLSTYGMLKNIPYLITATWIGHLIDLFTVRSFVMYLGIVMCIVLLVWVIVVRFYPKIQKV